MNLDELVLPPWASGGLRPHQRTALEQILDAYERGVRLVVLDAPTGTGKTLIGELARQAMNDKGLYVCSDKGLQDQFLADFPDSRVLKGRANYTPIRPIKQGGVDPTCDDCGGNTCVLCPERTVCPYIVARGQALEADTAVINSAYMLAELNGPGRFRHRKLMVVDEADTLESALMRWAEIRVGRNRARELGLNLPGPRVHYRTIANWIERELLTGLDWAIGVETDPKHKRALQRQHSGLVNFLDSFNRGDTWIRQPAKDALIMKPVEVSPFGHDAIWRYADNFLLMSASVVSAEMMVEGLGWTDDYEVVTVPMMFPVENRPIIVAPIADMSKKGKERGEWLKMLPSIRKVLDAWPDERVLIHSVSYDLTRLIHEDISTNTDRPVYHYETAADRESAVEQYAATPRAVLVAPSLERGVDFSGDLCRVVVVAKVPYPSLGDPQVAARMRETGSGQVWYTVETVRTLVQMTGRGVRSASDYATSYILDDNFIRLLKRDEHLFPQWWDEALVTDFDTYTLL